HRPDAHDAAPGKQDRVDGVDGADRLQQDHLRLAGRRSVVVDARRRRLVEEDGRAAGGPPRIGEVAGLEAGDGGDRSWRSGRGGALARLTDSRRRESGAPERRRELPPSHEMPPPRAYGLRTTIVVPLLSASGSWFEVGRYD